MNSEHGGHLFQQTDTFSYTSKILLFDIKTKKLTKFHEDRTIYVTSKMQTSFLNSHIRKNAPTPGAIKGKMPRPPPGGHVFKATLTIFELMQDIIDTNHLMKFHKD
ncbi:hypothetical protein DPMN_121707 [Dreissena polymorpha]|uniref:Uncharacterized protein n=1 Tax=Dreissena polymorpha TaxID=45954 RepID=A0A9D4JTD8_DREPO|nr:hypothetical protein DPMN_121707 [Dreissena polymorpha]